MSRRMNIFAFLEARLIEDQNELDHDERHWSEVPASVYSGQRLDNELRSKRTMLKNLAVMVEYEWSGQYAIRDTSRDVVIAMADVYADHPDYPENPWGN